MAELQGDSSRTPEGLRPLPAARPPHLRCCGRSCSLRAASLADLAAPRPLSSCCATGTPPAPLSRQDVAGRARPSLKAKARAGGPGRPVPPRAPRFRTWGLRWGSRGPSSAQHKGRPPINMGHVPHALQRPFALFWTLQCSLRQGRPEPPRPQLGSGPCRGEANRGLPGLPHKAPSDAARPAASALLRRLSSASSLTTWPFSDGGLSGHPPPSCRVSYICRPPHALSSVPHIPPC